MRLSQNEIKTLLLITSSERVLLPRDITNLLGLQRGSVSRIITNLRDKGLVDREDSGIVLARAPPADSFKRLYYAHRASPFQLLLADGRIELLTSLDDRTKSAKELHEQAGIPLKTIYYYLHDLARLGVVVTTWDGKRSLYSFNYVYWGALKDFVSALQEYDKARLVPRDALLIKIYEDGVLFKSLRAQDATFTSFSAYIDYGIELGLRDNYYTLPKRELSIEEVFIHSLDSAEGRSQRLFCILFYLRNRDKLQGILHPMMKDIEAVLKGEKVKGYPSLEDIEDRTEMYGIEL
jgi:predicted transcriptional regulator